MSETTAPKKQPIEDWHPADIVAALRKKGWSLSQLSLKHYPSRYVLKTALARKWPKGERIIAEAIGVSPQAIWPSRYATHERRQCTARRRPCTRRL